MPKGACLFIIKDGLVLAVSRKDDHTNFGLPGGKIEPGETAYEAAIRETLEETGIKCTAADFLYATPSATTFIASVWSGEPYSTEEGLVKWVEPDVITLGTYGYYNDQVLKEYAKTLTSSYLHKHYV